MERIEAYWRLELIGACWSAYQIIFKCTGAQDSEISTTRNFVIEKVLKGRTLIEIQKRIEIETFHCLLTT